MQRGPLRAALLPLLAALIAHRHTQTHTNKKPTKPEFASACFDSVASHAPDGGHARGRETFQRRERARAHAGSTEWTAFTRLLFITFVSDFSFLFILPRQCSVATLLLFCLFLNKKKERNEGRKHVSFLFLFREGGVWFCFPTGPANLYGVMNDSIRHRRGSETEKREK